MSADNSLEGQIVLEEYKIRVDYLNRHYARLWQRFNFFITIELALLGFQELSEIAPELKDFMNVVGLVVSLIWFFLAFQDRELVVRYKQLALRVLERLAPDLVPDSSIDPKKEFIEDKYYPRLSLTKFPMALSILAAALWIGLLVF